jgi:hypothetical protein
VAHLGGPAVAQEVLIHLRSAEALPRLEGASDLNHDLFPRDEFLTP